jgi:hypothetical protein
MTVRSLMKFRVFFLSYRKSNIQIKYSTFSHRKETDKLYFVLLKRYCEGSDVLATRPILTKNGKT